MKKPLEYFHQPQPLFEGLKERKFPTLLHFGCPLKECDNLRILHSAIFKIKT